MAVKFPAPSRMRRSHRTGRDRAAGTGAHRRGRLRPPEGWCAGWPGWSVRAAPSTVPVATLLPWTLATPLLLNTSAVVSGTVTSEVTVIGTVIPRAEGAGALVSMTALRSSSPEIGLGRAVVGQRRADRLRRPAASSGSRQAGRRRSGGHEQDAADRVRPRSRHAGRSCQGRMIRSMIRPPISQTRAARPQLSRASLTSAFLPCEAEDAVLAVEDAEVELVGGVEHELHQARCRG